LVDRHEGWPDGAGKTVEKPEHRGSKKIRYGLEPVRQAFLSLGEAAERFLAGLQDKNPRNCGFHARFILHLKETYHTDDIHRALHHALRYQAFDAKAIERILRAKAQPRTLESLRNEQARKELEKTLPQIAQRPLEDYCNFLTPKEKDGTTPQPSGSDADPHPSAPANPETDPDGKSPR